MLSNEIQKELRDLSLFWVPSVLLKKKNIHPGAVIITISTKEKKNPNALMYVCVSVCICIRVLMCRCDKDKEVLRILKSLQSKLWNLKQTTCLPKCVCLSDPYSVGKKKKQRKGKTQRKRKRPKKQLLCGNKASASKCC